MYCIYTKGAFIKFIQQVVIIQLIMLLQHIYTHTHILLLLESNDIPPFSSFISIIILHPSLSLSLTLSCVHRVNQFEIFFQIPEIIEKKQLKHQKKKKLDLTTLGFDSSSSSTSKHRKHVMLRFRYIDDHKLYTHKKNIQNRRH